MIEAIYNIEQSGEDLQAALTQYLGLAEPIPQAVVDRARRDDKFASLLFRMANHPDLAHLVIEKETAATPAMPHYTNGELLAGAAKSFLKWGMSGFSVTPQDELEHRMATCKACPNLQEAPDQNIYKIKLSKHADMRVCTLCGCVAARKARITGESCPANKW